MANWRHYMNNDFKGCRLIANARDHCRERDVRIFVIPGEAEAVGISDGTDRWIAPVSADCFSVNVKRLLDDIAAGKSIVVENHKPGRERKRLVAEETPIEPQPRSRRVLNTN